MRRKLFQAIVVAVFYCTILITAKQPQTWELGYRGSCVPKFNRDNIEYRATSVVELSMPEELASSGTTSKDNTYFILNKSVVFGPYEKIPNLNITGTINVDTSDWCRRLERDDVVDHGGYTNTYFANDGSFAAEVFLSCSTYEDGYRLYRPDDHQPAMDDGIYITLSFYCPAEEFDIPEDRYKNAEWASTASNAELLEYSSVLSAICESKIQGMKEYDVLDADTANKIVSIDYSYNNLTVNYDSTAATSPETENVYLCNSQYNGCIVP